MLKIDSYEKKMKNFINNMVIFGRVCYNIKVYNIN